MSDKHVMCSVWRSSRKEGMYLYLPKGTRFDTLDETLRRHFGAPEHAMDLLLNRERRLARADINDVLDSLNDKGFYLQMPPGGDHDIYFPGAGEDA